MRFILLFIGLLSLTHNKAAATADDRLERFKNATCMVAVVTENEPSLSTGTLVGVYTRADGSKHGLVLTTAHTFFYKGTPTEIVATKGFYCGVGFGDDRAQFVGELFTGAKIENWYKIVRYFYLPLEECSGQFTKDICLAEIILPSDSSLEPVQLYDGAGYTKRPNLSAKLFGYGPVYGPGATGEIRNRLKRNVSNFHVSYYNNEADLRGSACFRTYVYGTLTSDEIVKGGFADGFRAGSGEYTFVSSDQSEPMTIHVHAEASTKLPSMGYSGGALIFRTTRGYEVAGVYSQSSAETIFDTFETPLIAKKFESVPDHRWLYEAIRRFTEAGDIYVPEGVKVQVLE